MTTLNLQVNASGNDGDQNTNGLSGSIVRTELRLGNDSNPKIAGMRFLGVTVPQAATITSATLTVTWSFTYSTGNTIQGNIYGENVDNSAIFTATNSNISGRALTTAVVASGSINNVTLNATKAWTVTAIVQEIIDRAGWASGNALSILFKDNSSTSSEWQEIFSYDGSTTKCAKLDIVYTAGGASYNESGSGVSGVVSAGAERAAYVTTGAGVTGDVAFVSDAMTARETGPGIAGVVAVGADAKSAAESGAGIASATASGADSLNWTETAAGISGLFAAGADVAALSDSGYGLADAIASGADTYTSAGGAAYNETGAGIAGAAVYAVDVAALIDSGYSIAGLIPSGADALAYVETGAGIIGSDESGNDGYTGNDYGAGIIGAIASALDVAAILDSGYGLAGAVASGNDSATTGGAASKTDYTRQSEQDVAQAQPDARAQGQHTAQSGNAARARGSKVA